MHKSPGLKRTHGRCRDCPALCCHNLSIRILKPRNKREIEDLKWHLYYDTVTVYIANNRWHLYIKGTCRNLGRNKLCRIYRDRPSRCRMHNPPYCERYGEFYDAVIKTPEELVAHLNSAAARNLL